MNDIYNVVMNSEEIPENYKYYWSYQYLLGVESVVPYSKKVQCFKAGESVMEIGSAEGGVLHAFIGEGAVNATGTDIAQNRLDMGNKIAEIMKIDVSYNFHDILSEEIPSEWAEKFDLVLLRDVIEHLDDTYSAVSKIRELLRPGGFLLVTFPPYYSPFGGHQHTVGSLGGKLPYIHLLPNFIFHVLIGSGRANDIGEVKRLQNIRLTPKKFEKAALEAGYEIHKKDFYLLRPVFKMKFGLPTIKLSKLASLPLVKGFLSLEACYVLKNKD